MKKARTWVALKIGCEQTYVLQKFCSVIQTTVESCSYKLASNVKPVVTEALKSFPLISILALIEIR